MTVEILTTYVSELGRIHVLSNGMTIRESGDSIVRLYEPAFVAWFATFDEALAYADKCET